MKILGVNMHAVLRDFNAEIRVAQIAGKLGDFRRRRGKGRLSWICNRASE